MYRPAWLVLLVFATGGHYTAGIGMYLLLAGAIGAVVTVFGMRRYWDQDA